MSWKAINRGVNRKEAVTFLVILHSDNLVIHAGIQCIPFKNSMTIPDSH